MAKRLIIFLSTACIVGIISAQSLAGTYLQVGEKYIKVDSVIPSMRSREELLVLAGNKKYWLKFYVSSTVKIRKNSAKTKEQVARDYLAKKIKHYSGYFLKHLYILVEPSNIKDESKELIQVHIINWGVYGDSEFRITAPTHKRLAKYIEKRPPTEAFAEELETLHSSENTTKYSGL
jgi:hypothetical protein